MKVLTPIKRVPDPFAKVTPGPDGRSVVVDGEKHVINPFCEIALEEAIRLKEAGMATEVVAVTVGGAEAAEQLRTALAMGADRAVHIQVDETLDPPAIAKFLAAFAKRESPQIILLGKQAVDLDNNAVGQYLAAYLGVPQATFASKIEISGSEATVARETDSGIETIRVALPAVITTDLRLNEPRYVSLTGIVRARSKPLETLSPADLGVSVRASVRLISVEAPPKRQGGRKVASVSELVRALKEEAKVI